MLRRAAVAALAASTVLALTPAQATQRPGHTVVASLAWDGAEGDGPSGGGQTPAPPAVSDDGRFVAFESDATNLVPGDATEVRDLFVRDLEAPSTERISLRDDGGEADRPANRPSMSADGRIVAWESTAALTDVSTAGRMSIYVRDRFPEQGPPRTELVSVALGGGPANGASSRPSVSATGRYVAYFSYATNLVEGTVASGPANVFVYDRETGHTRRTSIGIGGAEPDNTDFAGGLPSGRLGISSDGRHVAFSSRATNLVADDTNEAADIFVHDLVAGTTERVSVNDHGEEANRRSLNPSMSDDGRYVAFESEAHNLVPGWANGQTFDVYVRDRELGVTERVSIPSDGREMSGSSMYPRISGDGRYVAFEGFDGELAPGGSSGLRSDIYLHDRHTRRTERVSVTDAGELANQSGFQPEVSREGRYVVWRSRASNLGGGSTNNQHDVYVRDRGPEVGVLGEPAISVSGDEVHVSGTATFAGGVLVSDRRERVDPSMSEHLGERLTGAAVAYRPDEHELVLRIGVHDLPVHAPAGAMSGTPGVVYGFAFRVDGVEHQVRATSTGGRPWRGAFGLFRCDPWPACRPLSYQLGGGYGTSGQEVVFPVPLTQVLGAEGSALTDVRAFSSVGELNSGWLVPLDEIVLEDTAVPQRRLELGLGARGGDPETVQWTVSTVLTDHTFSEVVSTTGHPPGPVGAFVRICHGQTCSVTEHSVHIP